MKKSQVTIFIIIGLLIIFIAGLVLFVRNTDYDFSFGGNEESKIKAYIEGCITETTIPIVFSIAETGGENTESIYYDAKRLNYLLEYKTDSYVNKYFRKSDLSNQISDRIESDFKSCLDYSQFIKQGFSIDDSDPVVETIIRDNNIVVDVDYIVSFQRETETINFKDFSTVIEIPLGNAFLIANDIINSEAHRGIFDKEDYMLKHGVRISKHKPYPNTVYGISINVPKYNRDLQFNFAIKGADTVGNTVLKYIKKGCCIDEDVIFANVDQDACLGIFKTSCIDLENFETDISGCCKTGSECMVTSAEICTDYGGEFFAGDLKCSKTSCANLNCGATYNYVEDDMSGPARKHGESWCSYESVVSKGLDYVGTRHYLHSCINGIHYIEECRDYREEICTEQFVQEPGGQMPKGICRVNKWYDCVVQRNKQDCENTQFRDCYWADHLYTDQKCYPNVPPGLKFWEKDDAVCQASSLNKNDFGHDYPKSWGHSAFLLCQRSGDCGNSRNYADEISKGGYYNQDGEVEDWAYLDEGYTSKGDKYIVASGLFNTELKASIDIPRGQGGGDSVCSLWKAPTSNKCSECESSGHPCTEYRCRSLGKDCRFDPADNSCSVVYSNVQGPEIEVVSMSKDYEVSYNKYYNNIEYLVKEPLKTGEAFEINFKTYEPTRCKLTLSPPGLTQFLVNLPEILLNKNDYLTEYETTIRFPPINLTSFDSYRVFIECENEDNAREETGQVINLDVEESHVVFEIIDVFNASGKLGIFTNKEFDECRSSAVYTGYESMNILACNSSEILYKAVYPLGSYACIIENPEQGQVYVCSKGIEKTAPFSFE